MRAMWLRVIFSTVGVHAAPSDLTTVTLEYRAPEGCPDEDAVRVMLREALDSVPTGEHRNHVRAVAMVEEDDPSRFRLELEIDDGTAARRRSLDDESCRQLMQTGAMLVAIAVDPRIAAALAEPVVTERIVTDQAGATAPDWSVPAPNSNAYPVEPADRFVPHESRADDATAEQERDVADLSSVGLVPPSTNDASVRGPTRRRAAPAWDIGLAGGGEFNVLPGLAANVSLGLGVHRDHWRLEAAADIVPTKRGSIPEATGRFSLVTVVLRACGVLEAAAFLFPLCGGLSVGGIRGQALDTAETGVAWFPWLSAHAGPAVQWRVHPRIHPFARVDVLFPVVRGTFVVDPVPQPIHRPGVVGFAAQVGIIVPVRRRP